MSREPRRRTKGLVVIALALSVALAGAPPGESAQPDDANTGRVIRTLAVTSASPFPAYCTTNQAGTSLAVVQASKVLVLPHPAVTDPNSVLLVTSCLSSTQATAATLYYSKPTTGEVVKTVQTTKVGNKGPVVFAPGQGWAALAPAADQGFLFGCGTDGSIHKIEYSLFGNDPQGRVTTLPKPSGSPSITSCTGLAWDPHGNTLFESSSTVMARFQFNPATTSLSSPASLGQPPCGASGLSVAGGVLLVACNAAAPNTPAGSSTVYRLDKSSGAQLDDNPPNKLHTAMTFAASALRDLDCDPITFSKPTDGALYGHVDAVWSRVPASNQVNAFWVPPATCGLPPTATVFAPGACPDPPPAGSAFATYRNPDGSPTDGDSDGLWDCWEDGNQWPPDADQVRRPGIDLDGDGVRDVALCATVDTSVTDGNITSEEVCADPGVKDLFVEIDYMASHRPDSFAMHDVRTAFLNAPVDPPNGIRLHLQVDEEVPHFDNLALPPCTPAATAANGAVEFDHLKSVYPSGTAVPGFFGTQAERASLKAVHAKRLAVRYMLFGHNLVNSTSSAVGSNSSGCAEVPGDDTVITLGSWAADVVTGHGIGDRHQQAGTVMHELGHNLGLRHGGEDNINCKPNYLSVMSYTRQFNDYFLRPLDYSRAQLAPLNENQLDETTGVGPLASVEQTVYGFSPSFFINSHFVVPIGGDPVAGTPIDWDGDGAPSESAVSADINRLLDAGCDGTDGTGTALQVLNSSADWPDLQYNSRASLDYAGGHTANTKERREKTSAEEDASFKKADTDRDGVADAFACSIPPPPPAPPVPCAIDIRPGTSPKVLSLGGQGNIKVAFVSTDTFHAPTQLCRETLKLNGVGVELNNNNLGTCSISQNANGRDDLLCQFAASALPLGLSYGVATGQTTAFGTPCTLATGSELRSNFRARDLVRVVK